jgi:hypothetical protein
MDTSEPGTLARSHQHVCAAVVGPSLREAQVVVLRRVTRVIVHLGGYRLRLPIGAEALGVERTPLCVAEVGAVSVGDPLALIESLHGVAHVSDILEVWQFGAILRLQRRAAVLAERSAFRFRRRHATNHRSRAVSLGAGEHTHHLRLWRTQWWHRNACQLRNGGPEVDQLEKGIRAPPTLRAIGQSQSIWTVTWVNLSQYGPIPRWKRSAQFEPAPNLDLGCGSASAHESRHRTPDILPIHRARRVPSLTTRGWPTNKTQAAHGRSCGRSANTRISCALVILIMK